MKNMKAKIIEIVSPFKNRTGEPGVKNPIQRITLFQTEVRNSSYNLFFDGPAMV